MTTSADVDVRVVETSIDLDARADVCHATCTCACTCCRTGCARRARSTSTDVFGLLNNVAWTNLGPGRGRSGRRRSLASCAAPGRFLTVHGLDKFPRMTDYVVPTGVRIADADRVRLGAHLAPGTTVMHEGFVNFNAGTLGQLDGRGSHLAPAWSSATAATSVAAPRSWARSPAAARIR